MKPEIHTDMPNAEYHAHPAIGASGLKLVARSPLHYWAAYLDPERERNEPSMAMRIGTAWHTAIFEPARFGAEYAAEPEISKQSTVGKLVAEYMADAAAFEAKYAAIPDGVSKSKAGKALLAELAGQGKTGIEEAQLAEVRAIAQPLAGKALLPADYLQDVGKMAASALRHPTAELMLRLMPNGVAEQSMFWTDAETGVRCKIRPDYAILPGRGAGIIVDGKTTTDARADAFARQAYNLMYFMQAAYYVDGWQAVYGTSEPPPFYWLVQERDSPYCTAIYQATPAQLDYGRREYRALLQVVAECQRTGIWPGYDTTPEPLPLPPWIEKAIADNEEIEEISYVE